MMWIEIVDAICAKLEVARETVTYIHMTPERVHVQTHNTIEGESFSITHTTEIDWSK